MSTLDRYVLREIAVPLLVGLSLFFVVVAFAQVLTISDAVTGLGVSGADILQALIYSLPPLMGLLLPVSMLFATLLGVGRMASDHEVIGMSAGGVSPYRLLRVPITLSVVLALASGFALVIGEPWGIRGLRDLMSRSAQRALASGVRAGEFHEWVPGVTFIARERQGKELRHVVLADRRDAQRPLTIAAQRGRVVTGEQARDIVFELGDGSIVLHDEAQDTHRIIHFERSRYRLDVKGLVGNKAKTLSPVQEKDLATLWREMHDPAFDVGRRALLAITLHRKAALPLATIIFAVVAVPLACRATGGARARGFLYSSGIVAAYYYLGRWAELSARGGELHAVLAAWLPDLVGLAGMIVLVRRFGRSAV